MKKIFTLLALPLFAVVANAEVVTYAVAEKETHKAGEVVNVPGEGDAVATLTFGFDGEADYKEGKANDALADNGFSAYTEGNGVNGAENSGTVYIIAPKYNGSIEVGVVLNADKAFFVLENGTALTQYNGIKESEKVYKTYKFDVKGGSVYKVYCTGSKLGFYGFNYEFTAPSAPAVAPEIPKATANGQDDLSGGVAVEDGVAVFKFTAGENEQVYYAFVGKAAEAAEAEGMTHDDLPNVTFALVPDDGVTVSSTGTLYYFAYNVASTLKSKLGSVEVTITSGIEGIAVDENAPVEYYNLSGVRVANPENGIFIRRQGNNVTKVIVK